MDQLTAIVQAINSYLWGVTGLIPLLVGVGTFYTFKLKFVQIRKFGQAMRFSPSAGSACTASAPARKA